MTRKLECELVTWGAVRRLALRVARTIHADGFAPELVVAIGRGGYVPARLLCDWLDLSDLTSIRIENYRAGSDRQPEAVIRFPLCCDIAHPERAKAGWQRTEWAWTEMPVLRTLHDELADTKPLAGLRISGCLHITTEMANLTRALQAAGADAVHAIPPELNDEVARRKLAAMDVYIDELTPEQQRYLASWQEGT